MRTIRIASLLLAVSVVGGCGSADATKEESLPPPITAAEAAKLTEGLTQATVFARVGKSEVATGPDNATLKVGASRCYSYLAPGTKQAGSKVFFGETVFDSWRICFDNRGRLVHKDPPDGQKSPFG